MKENHLLFIPALILAIGIALGGYFIGHGIIERELFDRYVSVKGLAEQTVKADQSIWQISVGYSANDLNSLYQGIANSQKLVKGFWIAEGFKANEIDLQPAYVTDNQAYNYSNGNRTGPRYTASASLLLITPDVDRVKASSQNLNTLVQKNVVLSSSTINYYFNSLNTIKPKMLDAATANAEAAAEAFAKNSHSRLGGIREASQGQFTISDDNSNGISSINKKVRVVTSVDYFLK